MSRTIVIALGCVGVAVAGGVAFAIGRSRHTSGGSARSGVAGTTNAGYAGSGTGFVPPPPPPPPGGGGFISDGVNSYVDASAREAYSLCLGKGIPDSVCRQAASLDKYANPVTVGVEAGGYLAGKASDLYHSIF